MKHLAHRGALLNRQGFDVAGADQAPPLDFAAPPRFDRPSAPLNQKFLSLLTGGKRANEQEMQSGADEASGVHESSISGGDYSREQGVGRAPGWQWPWNDVAQAFNFDALSHVNPERSGLGLAPVHSGINPFVGTPEQAYSPITAMDQTTTFYENDPNQWYYFSPPPVVIPEASAPAYSEVAVLGGGGAFG